MARTLEEITRTVESLRRAAAGRDQRYNDVHDVRSGDVDTVVPGSMPDAWPKPIVGNMIDTSARDRAEVMGVMPSINCSVASSTDKAKKFSSKRTKIANNYVQASGLHTGKQVTVSDWYETYGMAIYCIEPDFANKRPHIRIENPMGVYPEFGMFGELKSYTKVWREEAIHLVAKFPALLSVLRQTNNVGKEITGWAEREIEVVKYCDSGTIHMYLPNHGNTIVDTMENPFGKVYVSIGKRPSYDRECRGAFDDAIWTYLAKSRMALLGLEATEKTVRAPLAVPRDVQKMTFGDDAIIRTDSPDKVRRVGIDVPTAAFQQEAMLDQELRTGTRTPEARTGNVDASIITGRGVQALMGGFNTIITTGQTVLSAALTRAIELCFEMDEKLWPNEKKTIRGMVQGSPFEESYTPAKDIDGDYTVDVTYGFAAGQDPARAIVGLLQLRGDQLISRDFFQRQLPMEIDVVKMQEQIDNEQMIDALKQGMMGYAQTIPQLALNGQDPLDALAKMAKIIDLRERGTSFADAVLKVFTPKEQPQGAPQAPAAPQPPGTPPAPGGAPTGAPGAEQPQGFDLMSLLSGLTGKGEATMSARTQRQAPI